MIYQYVPLVIFVASMVPTFCVVFWIRHQRRGRRSPLTVQLLRSPGESLSRQIEKVSEDLNSYFVSSAITPLTFFAMYLSMRYFGSMKTNWLVLFIPCLLFMAFFSVKLASALKKRNNLSLGLDCERAVGQELNQLMLDGFRVFHDFPAENFNIDHIVIGTNGVFAIETKGRAKPVEKGDKKNWSVFYDGQILQFPNWTEREYLPQARRQAEWVAKWLSSAVGEKVSVRPVLAVTGWMIDQKKPCDVFLYNGKNPQFIAKIKTETSLSPEMIQRISHQVEQKCRDVDALAYKKLNLKELIFD